MHHGNEQALRQGGQIEVPVEPVGKRGQVAGRIFGEGKGVVSPAQTGLQVAEYGVDPLKLRQIPRLAAADHRGLVRAVRHGDRVEAGQTVGVHGTTRRQVLPRG